jgi:DNA-binding transcriptional ArsR family regulator
MSQIRRQGLEELRELIQRYPGQLADFYIAHVMRVYGVKRKTASEWLQTLADAGLIEAHGTRIYPRGLSPEREEDIKKEQALLRMLREKTGEIIEEVEKPLGKVEEMPVSYETVTTTPKTQEHVNETKPSLEQPQHYILIYDLNPKMNSSERRQVYRRLNRVYHQLLKEGVYVERILTSTWLVLGKENVQRLASVLPEHDAKIKIYEVRREIS